MKNKPYVAIVMPNYNGGKYLEESIRSVMNQSYKNIHLFIFDDGSKDNSIKIIKKFNRKFPSKITFFQSKKNKGVNYARNFLIKKILSNKKYKYIAFIDSDDLYHPKKIEKQIKVLENRKEIHFVSSFTKYIDEKGKVIGYRNYPTGPDKIYQEFLIQNPINFPAVCIKREVFENVGLFDIKFYPAEDYELLFRIVEKYKGDNLPEYLYYYRIHSDQAIQRKLKKTLYNTIKLQIKYFLKRRDFFNIKFIINLILEVGLLIMPSNFVLRLYKKIRIKTLKTHKNIR